MLQWTAMLACSSACRCTHDTRRLHAIQKTLDLNRSRVQTHNRNLQENNQIAARGHRCICWRVDLNVPAFKGACMGCTAVVVEVSVVVHRRRDWAACHARPRPGRPREGTPRAVRVSLSSHREHKCCLTTIIPTCSQLPHTYHPNPSITTTTRHQCQRAASGSRVCSLLW